MTVEDDSGDGIVTAAIARPSVGTPPEARLDASDLNVEGRGGISTGAARLPGPHGVADRPGLGTEPDDDALGAPVAPFDAGRAGRACPGPLAQHAAIPRGAGLHPRMKLPLGGRVGAYHGAKFPIGNT